MKISMNKTMQAMLTAGVLVIPVHGIAAEGLNYGYIEGDYINLDVDEPNENGFIRDDFDNGNGYGIRASLPLSEMIFMYGNYADTESDFTYVDDQGIVVPGGVNFHKFGVGLGLVLPMSTTTDMVFSGGYADIDYGNFDLGANDEDLISDLDDDPSDGYTADVKLRSQLAEKLEGSVGARYTEIEDLDGVSVIGNLMYEFTPNFGLNLSVDAGDELLTWGLGARYSF